MTFHFVKRHRPCPRSCRRGLMGANCDGSGGSPVRFRRGPATVIRRHPLQVPPASQELQPSPPATSGRGHPGRGPVVYPVTYPFGAVVGMDDMRLALLLNAVSPAVGGVLVRGGKGAGEAPAVRAAA